MISRVLYHTSAIKSEGRNESWKEYRGESICFLFIIYYYEQI